MTPGVSVPGVHFDYSMRTRTTVSTGVSTPSKTSLGSVRRPPPPRIDRTASGRFRSSTPHSPGRDTRPAGDGFAKSARLHPGPRWRLEGWTKQLTGEPLGVGGTNPIGRGGGRQCVCPSPDRRRTRATVPAPGCVPRGWVLEKRVGVSRGISSATRCSSRRPCLRCSGRGRSICRHRTRRGRTVRRCR